jgi:hypothetical protein
LYKFGIVFRPRDPWQLEGEHAIDRKRPPRNNTSKATKVRWCKAFVPSSLRHFCVWIRLEGEEELLIPFSFARFRLSFKFTFQSNCIMDISFKGPGFGDAFRTIHTVISDFNDGSLALNALSYVTVPLPPMLKEGSVVKIKAVYNPTHGAFALDNLRVRSDKKCYPRWVKISGFIVQDMGPSRNQGRD